MIAATALSDFAPVSLAELESHAALLVRTDRKYVLDDDLLASLLADHRDALTILDIDGERSFRYRSMYFDTEDHALHRAAATGRRRRAKVRIRAYDSGTQPSMMLEVKTKDGRGATVKHRLEHPFGLIDDLGADGRRYVDEVTGTPGLGASLVPILQTSYRRSTLVDTRAGTRATIDTHLECTHADGRSVRADGAVVESKSGQAPSDLDRWMWRHGARPERLSKYCTALVVLCPDLPGNRWHRTVARHFSTAPVTSNG